MSSLEIVRSSQPGLSTPNEHEWNLMMQQARILIESGFLPPHLKRAEQVVALMLKSRELQIPPMEGMAQLFVTNGKVTCQTSLMMALIKRAGLLERRHKEFEYDGDGNVIGCSVSLWRKGEAEPYTGVFDMIDAQRAKLLGKQGWQQYPKAMLYARAASIAAREGFSDVIGGLYTHEEMGMDVKVDSEGNEAPLVEGEAVLDLEPPKIEVEREAPPPAPAKKEDPKRITKGQIKDLWMAARRRWGKDKAEESVRLLLAQHKVEPDEHGNRSTSMIDRKTFRKIMQDIVQT